GVVGNIHQALHAWCPAAVVLWTIVEIDDQGREVGRPVRHHVPPPPQTIDQTVTGHFGADTIQKPFIPRWQEEAHWGHGGVWVKVVVSGDSQDAARATAGKRTDFDARFRIHRDASHGIRRIGHPLDPSYVVEDGVRFWQFVWG